METDDLDPSSVIFHQPLPLAARRSDHVWGAVPSPVRLAVDWLNKKGTYHHLFIFYAFSPYTSFSRPLLTCSTPQHLRYPRG